MHGSPWLGAWVWRSTSGLTSREIISADDMPGCPEVSHGPSVRPRTLRPLLAVKFLIALKLSVVLAI